MNHKTSTHWQWKTYGVILGIYTLHILLRTAQTYFSNMHSVNPKSLIESIGLWALSGYSWALFTLPIAWLIQRFPVLGTRLLRNLLLHFGFGILFGALHRAVIVSFVYYFVPASINIPQEIAPRIFYFLHFLSDGFFDYVLILAVLQAIIYFKEVQQREFRLQQAELQALKTQLHPHFLFNTLNAISSLSFHAPEIASRVIAQLSDLLRFSLKTEQAAEITLKEELDFVRKYLEIQQTLLEERLEIKWNIAPETLDAYVPNMFLQPLVENSIRHGIAPKEDGGWIEINSRRAGKQLEISVKDNGLGISSNENRISGGIGLSNTRARLRHLYGEAHKFALSQPSEGGVLNSLTIPFKERNRE